MSSDSKAWNPRCPGSLNFIFTHPCTQGSLFVAHIRMHHVDMPANTFECLDKPARQSPEDLQLSRSLGDCSFCSRVHRHCVLLAFNCGIIWRAPLLFAPFPAISRFCAQLAHRYGDEHAWKSPRLLVCTVRPARLISRSTPLKSSGRGDRDGP